MRNLEVVGGLPVITLRAARPDPQRAGFVEATILPGRGFMLLQAIYELPSGKRLEALVAPGLEVAAAALDGGSDDFAGNASFGFGGALLVPYANRVRGVPLPGSREIATRVEGREVRLPRNWGGKAPGAAQYAMHGLILDRAVPFVQSGPDAASGELDAKDFDRGWPGSCRLGFRWRLADGALRLRVEAQNVGSEFMPMGIGWHPYLRLPSGERAQARLHLPAASRVEVNDYDEVLPTGRLLPVNGSSHDFATAEGRPLGDLYLDDCFTSLQALDGWIHVGVSDARAGVALQLSSRAPPALAVQVYAPPDEAFIAIEPQTNLADPYGAEWSPSVEPRIVRVGPGLSTLYEAVLTVEEIGPQTS